MSHLTMAESLLKAGNVAAAYSLLLGIPKGSLERDLLLAQCCKRRGDAPGAIVAFTNALGRDPANGTAASGLAALHVQLKQFDKAEAVYTRALKKKDDDKLRAELAVLLWSSGRQAQALTEIGRVLARNPRFFAARQQRVNMLLFLNRNDEAAADLEYLQQHDPDNPAYLDSRGTLEFRRANFRAAIPLMEEACRRKPSDGGALCTLALSQLLSGELEASEVSLQRLRTLDPSRWQKLMDSTELGRSRESGVDSTVFDPRPAFLLMAFQEQMECNWSNLPVFEKVFRELIADPRNSDPGLVAHCSGIASLTLEERRKLMGTAARAATADATPFTHVATPVPERLRIGYVFPHVGDHVVASIMLHLLAAHDPARVEIHVFSTAQRRTDYESDKTGRYLSIPGLHYTDLTPLDEAAAAAKIHALGLDVLVDLAVYNDHARPGIVASRPAPVQVNFLGAPFTSGGNWLDYIIVDERVSPGVEGWCTEAEVRVPSSYFVYGHDDAAPPDVPPRSAFGLPEDRFLFSGLNNPYKIDPKTFDAWMRILAATGDSLLLLKAGKDIQARLQQEAVARDIDPARLFFVPRLVSDRDYLLHQGCPDLFLDTRLYGAHTTMAESLWMGVPGISCPGDSFQSRVGASLLASCDLEELITPDWESYEALAIALYRDRERLAALKARLAQTRLTAAPFDMAGQARNLEKAYRHMRERFAQGLPPAPFRIADLA